jgi:alpha-N-arabinofuranosidase
MRFDKKWIDQQARKPVTTALLGRAQIPDLPYEQPDGAPIRIDKDYLAKSRNESNPTPGPFERPGTGDLRLKVW